ncbi:histidine kinase [Dokdonella sp.]|uniref:sensor histidine kinase n=1 Tax=Dokdonella sp. TaxID=2291710 RepID=UPI00261F43E1|nr:histidine kinase [Dokdonella sp.]
MIPVPAPLARLSANSSRLFWLLQSVGWTGYFALSYLTAIVHGKPAHYVLVSAAAAGTGFVVTLLLRYGYRAALRLPWPHTVAAALAMLVAAVAIYAKLYAEVVFAYCAECRPDSALGYIGYLGSVLYVLLSWTGFYFGIRIGRQLAREREAVLQARAMAHEAQLKMLRYQLNPHFLFNTLNAISTLILDGRNATANRMVSGLSTFLRHTLDSDPVQCVPLGDEIAAIERYLGIEQVRFGERLRVRIEADEFARRALVPSLILQPLIENSIKYAIQRRAEGGCIEVLARTTASRLVVCVRDDGPGLSSALGAGGVGLANTRERLRVLYGDRQQVRAGNREEGGFEVCLDLPLRPADSTEERA